MFLKRSIRKLSKLLKSDKHMHHRIKVKKIFKVVFVLIQALVFISSIAISVLSFTIFYKGRILFQIPFIYMFMIQLISIFALLSSLIGLKTINSRKHIKLYTFITLTLILMNLEVIASLKSSLLPEKAKVWGNRIWDSIEENQKSFIQDKFLCCGYNTVTDRQSGECKYPKTCSEVLYYMSVGVRSLIEKSMIFLFFIESTGIGIITMLKLRRR